MKELFNQCDRGKIMKNSIFYTLVAEMYVNMRMISLQIFRTHKKLLLIKKEMKSQEKTELSETSIIYVTTIHYHAGNRQINFNAQKPSLTHYLSHRSKRNISFAARSLVYHANIIMQTRNLFQNTFHCIPLGSANRYKSCLYTCEHP